MFRFPYEIELIKNKLHIFLDPYTIAAVGVTSDTIMITFRDGKIPINVPANMKEDGGLIISKETNPDAYRYFISRMYRTTNIEERYQELKPPTEPMS